MEEIYYQLAAAIFLIATILFSNGYFSFKKKLSQARDLLDQIDEALKDDKVSKAELMAIAKEKKVPVPDVCRTCYKAFGI